LEKSIPSKQLVQFESLGKFLQDVWLMSFLLVFISSETTVPMPFMWIIILFAIAILVTLLFRVTGYQIAVSLIVSVVIGGSVFFVGAPLWLFAGIVAFAIWRIQERFAKEQEDASHDGIFFTALVIILALVYFLATVLNNPEAMKNALLLAVIGLTMFVLDRMIVQWLHSKESQQVPLSRVLGVFAGIIGLASIAFGLIAGVGSKARVAFVSIFGDVLMVLFYPVGILMEWLRSVFMGNVKPFEERESQSQAQYEYEEKEKVISDMQNASVDFPWVAIISVIVIILIGVLIWRLSKYKKGTIEVAKENAQYERHQVGHISSKKETSVEWTYSMETNIVRDAYRDFEKQAGESGFRRTQNETVREWFNREDWPVSERFFEVYDMVRYSGELMNEQDGTWFIDELNKLSKKNLNKEV